MKRFILQLVLLGWWSSGAVLAQESVAQQVTRLLGQMPAYNSNQRTQQVKRLVEMGQEGIVTIAARLETGDPTAPEYALSGLSYFVTQPGQESARKLTIAAYHEALRSAKSPTAQTFLLYQLQQVADPSGLAELSRYLGQEGLCGAAARVMAQSSSSEAGSLLFRGLSNTAGGTCERALIQALGALGYAPAASALEKRFVNAPTDVDRRIIGQAMAGLGAPSSRALLAQAAQKARYAHENSHATDTYIRYLKKLYAQPSHRAAARQAIQALWRTSKETAPEPTRIAVLGLLVEAEKAAATPMLLTEIEHPKASYRVAVVRLATPLVQPSTLSQWRQRLPRMAPDVQADVLRMLSHSAVSQQVLPLLNDARASSALPVRLVAIEAMSRLQPKESLPFLLETLETGTATEQAAAQEALAGLKGEGVMQALEQGLKIGSLRQQTQLVAVLAKRIGTGPMHSLHYYALAGDASLRTATLRAISDRITSEAAYELLGLWPYLTTNTDRNTLLEGYLQTVKGIRQPATQRVLLLREALKIAQTQEQRVQVLTELGQQRTFQALLAIRPFLDQEGLRMAAAKAIAATASNTQLDGPDVQQAFQRAHEILKNQNEKAALEALEKRLAAMPKSGGLIAIFNGKDLTGWKGLVANPIKRQQMDAATLATEQAKADQLMRAGWVVQNGELVFVGKGDNLCTTQAYEDIELYVDWKIEPEGDAGIYLRGTPQVQIWDTSRVQVGAQVGSGGLYNNQKHERNPLKVADNPIGQWNTFFIRMQGDRVTVYLNGELVVDNVILENYWNRALPIFRKEQLELQAHGTKVYYRDIYVKELTPAPLHGPTAAEVAEGFVPLFDGSNMHAWTGNTRDYITENGEMVIYPDRGGRGNLYTKEEYSDFVFRFEFKLTPGANNGLGIRAPLEGDAAYVGMELQILDNEAEKYKSLAPYQYHGSVYGVIAAKRGHLKPVGEWNSQEVVVQGTRIKVTLNGVTILDGDIAEASKNGTLDKLNHPGLLRTQGHIGFLGHGDVVYFRNIRVKRL